MHDLVYGLVQLCYRNRDSSFTTQRDRLKMLKLIGTQLVALGYGQMRDIHALKGRHVNRLVARWKAEGVSHATIRNRLAAIRWWCEKVGKRGVIPERNTVFGLEPRSQVARVSKATTVGADALEALKDPYIRMSVELQEAFGLRRKECLMIQPHVADQGSYLVLRASWTKGGRARVVPISSVHQREVLDRAKQLVSPGASLIPAHKTFAQQRNRYVYVTGQAGLSKLHGLRHGHFQERYAELSGMPAPVQGGPHRESMTTEEQEKDRTVRLIVSAEMGHCRPQITANYLGR